MGGFTISVLLLVISAVYRDGMSVCATLSLSGLSTLSGLANSCKLKLPRRKDPYEEEPAPQPRDGNRERRPPPVPPGDTVIRYPNGSFIIIKCEEDVARELFFAPEELEYRVADEKWYRFLSLIGTVLLMAGILFLANATLPLQIGWALAYGLINVGYWIVAGISPRRHWDFSSYTMREVGLASDEIKEGGRETRPSFTLALWKAIVLTKNTSWVKHSDAAPRTVAWNAWVKWADARVHKIKPRYRVKRGPLIDPFYDDSQPDTQIWDDDVNKSEPWGKLMALVSETSLEIDDDGMPPAPSTV